MNTIVVNDASARLPKIPNANETEATSTAPLKAIKGGGENTVDFLKEIVNSLIHGIGILFGIAAIPVLTAFAVKTGDFSLIAGAGIYGFSFLMVFTFSTMYHGIQEPGIKKILEVLDHISIYFLIAGTYTPLILKYMNNGAGFTMLYILWGLALAGTFFKTCFGCRYNIVSTIVYLLMGWMLVWTGGSLFRDMPSGIITLVILGGALYTVGVTFYLANKWRWSHTIWHTLVLGAAVCHFAAVFLTVSAIN